MGTFSGSQKIIVMVDIIVNHWEFPLEVDILKIWNNLKQRFSSFLVKFLAFNFQTIKWLSFQNVLDILWKIGGLKPLDTPQVFCYYINSS